MPNISIKIGRAGRDCKITIGDRDITHLCRGVTVNASALDMTRVVLEVLDADTEIELDALIDRENLHIVHMSDDDD